MTKREHVIRAYRYKTGLFQKDIDLVADQVETQVIQRTCKPRHQWDDKEYDMFAEIAETLIWGGEI